MMPKGRKRFIYRITRPNVHSPLLISSNFDSLHAAVRPWLHFAVAHCVPER
jgi:hypothetical protein